MTQVIFSYPKASMGRMDLAAVSTAAGASIGTHAVQVCIDTTNLEAFGNGPTDGGTTGKLAVLHALRAIMRKVEQGYWPPAV